MPAYGGKADIATKLFTKAGVADYSEYRQAAGVGAKSLNTWRQSPSRYFSYFRE
jgi:hypothetical protein